MSYPFWERHFKITVAGNNEEARSFGVDFDISFEIVRTNGKEPNTAAVSIKGLNKASRGAFETEYKRIWIEAGYVTRFANVFAGEIATAESKIASRETVTTITAGDGDLAWVNGAMNETFAAGSKVSDVVRQLVQRGMPGVTVGSIIGLDDDITFVRPYVANGATRDRLTELARTYNAQWSIQNGEFEMIARNRMGTQEAVVLTPDSGLIGSPAKTEKGIRAVCLLNGALKPNEPVIIESETLSPNRGIYKIIAVKHSGSTEGNNFFSEVECISLAGQFVEVAPTADQAIAIAKT